MKQRTEVSEQIDRFNQNPSGIHGSQSPVRTSPLANNARKKIWHNRLHESGHDPDGTKLD